jgi:hypothetical protein
MLGHAEEWFYRGLAGIHVDMSRKPPEQIRIEPAVVGDLAHVEAHYRAVLGEVVSNWTRQGKVFSLTVRIPVGVHATVVLPPEYRQDVLVNGQKPASAPGVSDLQASGGTLRCIVSGPVSGGQSGGEYRFVAHR